MHVISDNPIPLRPMTHQWVRIGEWILFALLVTHFCVRTVPAAWHTLKTDFPDYYLPAALAHQHVDTSRVYEWIWLERQKDHRDIDLQMISLVPSTGFSALVLYPLTSMSLLAAKHCWLLINFGLLIATLYLLRDMTHISWSRIALVAALSFPLRGNFITGQYYVLLLFLLTLACYLYLRQKRFLAGVIIGLTAGLKIFPVIYLLYFLRKRDMKAFAGGLVGGIGAAIASLLAFGVAMNRTYFVQVLPWTLRGEALATYTLKSPSFSSLLHRLFIYEPHLNPHPAFQAPWLFAVLHPVLQMAVLAPALFLTIPDKTCQQPACLRRVRVEWAAILLASLAISTSPQSYQFTLLILPACVVLEALQPEANRIFVAILLLLFTATGIVSGTDHVGPGWAALLGVPRLYILILSCALVYALLIRQQPDQVSKRDRIAWAAALGVMLIVAILGNLRHQQGLYDDYKWRIPIPDEAHMAVNPAIQGNDVLFVAMLDDGYHSAAIENGMKQDGLTHFNTAAPDQLALTVANGRRWLEQAGTESTIISTLPSAANIPQAESPVASFDGRWMAYVRENQGRSRIWIRALDSPTIADKPVTPPDLDALEMSFLPNGDMVFSAISGSRPGLFTATGIQSEDKIQSNPIQSLDAGEARYPAVSPDGHWLAYSRLQNGNWNLWLRDLTNGQTQRLTHAECNATEPAWAADSRTLVYASDCGRALWFSTLCRRQVVP